MAEVMHARIVLDSKAITAEIEAIKANPTPDWEQRLMAFITAHSRLETV